MNRKNEPTSLSVLTPTRSHAEFVEKPRTARTRTVTVVLLKENKLMR